MPVTPAAARPAGKAFPGWMVPALAAALAAAIVYRGALGYFFSQDDFLGLARASGLAPRLAGPWRFLSHQLIYDLMRPLAGLEAWPYHVVSLATHAGCAAMLAMLLARRVSRPAALVGAVFFAAHPASFDAVYWFSAIGDSLALLFALAAMLLALRDGAARWLALPACALSLLSKESTLALPLVVALVLRSDRARPGPPVREALGLIVGLAAIALALVASFAAGDAFRVRDGLPASAPYAIGTGAHLVANLFTYLGWTVAFAYPVVRGFSDAVDPAVYAYGVSALVLWSGGLASPRLRRAGWALGGIVWLAFLLPVLGLRNHTYHYYLYAPLAGAAWCVAAAAEWALARPGGTGARRAWVPAWMLALALTANGVLLARKIETMPMPLPELRASTIIDRARIAANVQSGLAGARLPEGVTLLFWSPIATTLGPRGQILQDPSPSETYWERNVRDALLDGLAVRVMFPQVAAVRFVRRFEPAPADHWYAVYRPEGRLGVATPAVLDSIIRGAGPGR